MRNVVLHHCKSGGNRKDFSRTLLRTSSSSVFLELYERFSSPNGLSITRKEVLLSDGRLFAVMEKRARREALALSQKSCSSSMALLSNETEQRCGGGCNKKKKLSLYFVIRSIAEFIASTGSPETLLLPPHVGYTELTPTDGLRRAELVFGYTTAALSFSNDWMASIVAHSFRRCYKDNATVITPIYRQEQTPFHSTREVMMVEAIEHGEIGSAVVGSSLLRGADGDATHNANNSSSDDENVVVTAPLTSQEVVALLQWCTWHIRTTLNGVKHKLPLSVNCVPTAVTLLSRFLALLVDKGLRSLAIEALEHEVALSDMAFIVTDQVLELLYFATSFRASNCSHSFCATTGGCLKNFGNGTSANGGVAKELGSTSNEKDSSDGRKRLDGWRISVDTQWAFLCTQRERWERALSLLLRTQRWNMGLDENCHAAPLAPETKEKKDLLAMDVLRTLLVTPRSVVYMLEYIFAEHGQWGLCRQLWEERMRQRRFEAASLSSTALTSSLSLNMTPHSSFGVDKIMVALAFVNARVSFLSSFAVLGEQVNEKHPQDLRAKFLRILLQLGITPHQVPSMTEFATFLRNLFNLSLGREHTREFLMPSFVWRLTRAYPRRVRISLCLLSFQVVIKSSLTYMLELGDIYIVASLLRQFLQHQAYSVLSTKITSVVGRSKLVEEHFDCDFVDDKNVNTATNKNEKEKKKCNEGEFEALESLLAQFSSVTRRMLTVTEAQVVAIAEAFLIHHREFFSVEQKKAEWADKSCGTAHTNFATTKGVSKGNKSTSLVLFSLLSRELVALVSMVPSGIAFAVTWQAVLCAVSTEAQQGDLDHHFLHVVEFVVRTMAKKAVELKKTMLLEPIVRLASFLSPFTVSKIVQGPVGRMLSWEHCLQLFSCTPWASGVQLYLLRRVMRSRTASELPANLRSFVRAVTPPPRLLHTLFSTRATDIQVLTIFAERDWCRALEAYSYSGSRVQWACAPHVMRLIMSADVWRFSHENDFCAFWHVMQLALRAVDGEHMAEDVLHCSLRRGQWATGLAFYQFLLEYQPDMVRANSKIRGYKSLLCKGLLSQSSMTRTIAEVVKSAREADWAAACKSFICYVTAEDTAVERPISPLLMGISASSKLPRRWFTLFNATLSSELSHFAHTVRYSMLFCHGMWVKALQWFPTHVLPLPLHHSFLLQRLTGLLANTLLEGDVRQTRANVMGIKPSVMLENGSATTEKSSRPYLTHSSTSMSLVQIALQEKIHCTRTPAAKISVEMVEQALRTLQRRGLWEQTMVVCEHALANRCFPHSASALVLGSCAFSWEASITCFTHLTTRMRPDAATAVLALKACVRGQQWVLALRILRQNALTNATAAPRVVHYAVKSALDSGVWPVALRVVCQYRGTSSPLLANTIMRTYVQAKCWNDAVGYFYDCVTRGMCPLDESLSMAITASQMVSAEYSDAARVVGVIASALEDFCYVHGVVLEHVLLVRREMTGWPIISNDLYFALISLAYTNTSPCCSSATVATSY